LTVSFSTSKRKTSSADYIWALTSYLPDSLRTPNSLYSNLLQPLNDIIRRQKQTAVQIEQSPKRNLIFKHYHMNSWRFWLRVFPVSSWYFHNWLPDIMRQRLCSSQMKAASTCNLDRVANVRGDPFWPDSTSQYRFPLTMEIPPAYMHNSGCIYRSRCLFKTTKSL